MPSRELTALRLAAQRIVGSTFTTPAQVVRHMLATQAQDFGGAKWSVGLRLPGSTDAAIEAALAAGEIVRSWPMRGTLHFVAPEDLGWMLAISRTRQGAFAARRRADLAITDAELVRAGDLAADAVTGGRVIRRDHLLELWQRGGIPTDGQRAAHLIWNLAHDGLLVFGPVDGKQQTFALLDEWVSDPRRLEGDEALAEYATRYFTSHGPATVKDFAWWASLTLGDARKGVAAATGIVEREFDDTSYLLAEHLEPAPLGVHALPGFDEYLLGYSDRSPVLPAAFSQQIVPGNNGMFLPTIIDAGQVVGTWKRVGSGKKQRIAPVPFTALRATAERGFAKAVARYAEFLGTELAVEPIAR